MSGTETTRRKGTSLKYRLIKAGLIVTGIALALYLWSELQTIYALSYRNLDMLFVVSDAETGQPIRNASIDVMTHRCSPRREEKTHLATDDEGRARFLQEHNSCEDIVRPFRRTITLIDLTWATVDVSADGYCPIQQLWLHDAKYEKKRYLSESNTHELEFPVQLRPRNHD